MSGPDRPPTDWTRRLLLAAAITAVPLFLVGGTITTVGAGMAVQGWWNAEGHFMPLFPLDEWFRDFGTFVEHKHRLWGIVVGACVTGATLAAFLSGGRRARLAATTALVAVVAQGSLGGFRVLENSPQLAFLHGVGGQGVFAILLAATLVASRRWAEATPIGTPLGTARAASWLLALAVYAQITLGAWYRHALRNGPPGQDLRDRLYIHMGLATAVLALTVVTARALERAADRGAGGQPLRVSARRLHALVGVQILLGFAAWLAYAPAFPGEAKAFPPLELTTAALHVLGGALLLAQALCAALWCGRLSGAPARSSSITSSSITSGATADR